MEDVLFLLTTFLLDLVDVLLLCGGVRRKGSGEGEGFGRGLGVGSVVVLAREDGGVVSLGVFRGRERGLLRLLILAFWRETFLA